MDDNWGHRPTATTGYSHGGIQGAPRKEQEEAPIITRLQTYCYGDSPFYPLLMTRGLL